MGIDLVQIFDWLLQVGVPEGMLGLGWNWVNVFGLLKIKKSQHPTRFKNSYIFLNKFDSFYCDADNFNKVWKRAHTATDTAYRIPYTCRHTRAAELLSIGIAPAEAAKQLGHSLQMFLDTYSEFIDEYCSEQDPLRFEGIAPQIQKLSQNCLRTEIVPIGNKKGK